MNGKDTEILNRALPKWPQMLVSGQSVSVERAKEIIRTTDSYFEYPSGNNKALIKWIAEELKYPYWSHDNIERPDIKVMFELEEEWRNEWGYICRDDFDRSGVEYITNSWLSCAYINGPHGWCHPDGTIQYTGNVGKWPSGMHLYKEWKCIAEKFPFLNLSVVLVNYENSPNANVMGFIIKDGLISIKDPLVEDILKDFPSIDFTDKDADVLDFIKNLNDPLREFGIPKEWIYEWGKLADEIFGTEWDDKIKSTINESKLNNILR